MAKGSANEQLMGGLHSRVARVFEKVLVTYENRLDTLNEMDTSEMEADEIAVLMNEGNLPNPAMLGAVTRFLKDNSIGLDTEEVEKLSATAERLNERKSKRTKLSSLTALTLVEASG